jgi:hypothetical protein
VGVVEDVGCRFAAEPVHPDEGAVALAQAGELIVVPAEARPRADRWAAVPTEYGRSAVPSR